MNQFTNPFTATNTFGYTNPIGSPGAYAACGTGCFPGVNSFNPNTIPSFQNPWSTGVGQWINTGNTPAFGYANAPTGWTNSSFNRYATSNTNGWNNGPFGFNPFNPTFGDLGNSFGWNTPFAWTNTNPSFGFNSFNSTPWFSNPGFFGGYNAFNGWNNAGTPTFTNSFGGFPWNNAFQTFFGSTPWNWNTATPWNWNGGTTFGTPWNTTANFTNAYWSNPGFFWANQTPSFTPAFFSNVNPNGFTPTNTNYYPTPGGQNPGVNPFQTGVTNQPNTNPGLCRDAA